MEFPLFRHGCRFRSNKSFRADLPKNPFKQWDQDVARLRRRQADKLAVAHAERIDDLDLLFTPSTEDALPKDEWIGRWPVRNFLMRHNEQGAMLIIHVGSSCSSLVKPVRVSTAYLNGCGPTHIHNYRRHYATPKWAIPNPR